MHERAPPAKDEDPNPSGNLREKDSLSNELSIVVRRYSCEQCPQKNAQKMKKSNSTENEPIVTTDFGESSLRTELLSILYFLICSTRGWTDSGGCFFGGVVSQRFSAVFSANSPKVFRSDFPTNFCAAFLTSTSNPFPEAETDFASLMLIVARFCGE